HAAARHALADAIRAPPDDGGARLPSRIRLQPYALFLALRQLRQFVPQLQITLEAFGCQPPFLNRRFHRAAWLIAMAAVGKVAAGSERFDLVKRLADTIVGIPQLQLAHARRVDD